MANRNWASGGKIYSMHVKPILLDCNFIVDSTNPNGVRSLKGPAIQAVYMNTSATPSAGNPNPGRSVTAGAPNLKTAASFAILAATTVTSTGATVVTGDLGLYPGTSVTGFPPGTVSGIVDIADARALQAKSDAQAAYTAAVGLTFTPISSTLDGQTLTPGNYSEASGTFNLAAAGAGTLTLNGAGVYIFKASSTLVTGAGGTPTITLTGGATAANVFWLVGSSATINSGFTGTFQGNILAVTSITDTLGGTVNGSMIALGGAVTLSAATNATVTTPPSPGIIIVRFNDNYNLFFTGFSLMGGPTSGSALTSTTANETYVITALGTATKAQWVAKGFPAGYTPQVGSAFVATASGSIGGSAAVQLLATYGSGINSMETIGTPNTTMASVPGPSRSTDFGAEMLFQCFLNGVKASPADGTLISMAFYLSDSSILIQGE